MKKLLEKFGLGKKETLKKSVLEHGYQVGDWVVCEEGRIRDAYIELENKKTESKDLSLYEMAVQIIRINPTGRTNSLLDLEVRTVQGQQVFTTSVFYRPANENEIKKAKIKQMFNVNKSGC